MTISRKFPVILLAVAIAITANAHTWTLKDGQAVDGEFDRTEGNWIILTLPDGSSTAVHYPDLVDDDRTLAKNLAAIFYDKPVPVDATPPKTRVQIKKPEKKKPPRKIEPEPVTAVPQPSHTPNAVTATKKETGQIVVQKPAATKPAPAVKNPPSENLATVEPTSEPETTEPQEQVIIVHKSKLDAFRQPTKLVKQTVKKTKWEHIASALDSSMKRNKMITVYFLILCLLIIIHKTHMPHLYKRAFRPKTPAPRATQQKEFTKEDEREKYRECPFCKLTNPTSAEKCSHCGQYIK